MRIFLGTDHRPVWGWDAWGWDARWVIWRAGVCSGSSNTVGGWEGCSNRVGKVKGVCGRQSSPSGFLIAQHFSQVDQISLTRHSQN